MRRNRMLAMGGLSVAKPVRGGLLQTFMGSAGMLVTLIL